jgi:hypothetical protein
VDGEDKEFINVVGVGRGKQIVLHETRERHRNERMDSKEDRKVRFY